jgi:hypothetical protein
MKISTILGKSLLKCQANVKILLERRFRFCVVALLGYEVFLDVATLRSSFESHKATPQLTERISIHNLFANS